jgi:N-acetylmuramoyl-L-alanine amidase
MVGRLGLTAILIGAACAFACGDDSAGIVRIEPAGDGSGAGPSAAAAPGQHGAAGRATARPVVFIDAGHGGRDPGWGSAAVLAGGPLEKDLTLDLAKRTAAYLEQDGIRVEMSRATDTDVNEPERDINGDGELDVVDEIQARIDKANASGAALLLSLHFNGHPSPSQSGAGTWYNAVREFSVDNLRLAKLVQAAQLEALRGRGYEPRDWDVLRDDTFDTPTQAKIKVDYKYFYLIGPVGPLRPRPSQIPGVIAEPLFLTNPKEAELARTAEVRDALARAYAKAVREFLGPDHSRELTAPGGPALLVDRGQTRAKVVALTFDAGAQTGYTAAILDALARAQVKATFGLTGAWCDANPDLAHRITAEGHAVINHTYSHTSWTGRSPRTKPLTAEQRRSELERAEQALRRTTGTDGRPFFRAPYGDEDAGVERDLGESGYRYNVLWTFDSNAWRGAKAEDIISRGRKAAAPGAIYVFHVAEQQDALALAPLIDGLKAAGYGFTTVPQLFTAQ